MANEKPIDDIGEVLQMADSCQNMLRQAIQAYMAYDSERAVNIAEQDGEIDNMQTRISNNIIQQMCVNTTLVPFGSCLLWIVHNLERLGDRATNICEQIVYIKSGKFMDLNR
jgi:phosphate transport system protein